MTEAMLYGPDIVLSVEQDTNDQEERPVWSEAAVTQSPEKSDNSKHVQSEPEHVTTLKGQAPDDPQPVLQRSQ